MVIGIDPGQKGGIACLDSGFMMVKPMPDIDSCWNWLELLIVRGGTTAYVEKVHSMPKQGVASTFKFGMGYGFIRGLLAGLGVPTVLVSPQTWKKVMLAGENKDDQKTAAVAVASRLWPNVDFRPSSKCRKPSDGMAEAALIAEYGRRAFCEMTCDFFRTHSHENIAKTT